MKKIVQKIYWFPALLLALLLLTQNAFAGAPEGHPESLDSKLRHILEQRLDDRGYMGDFRDGNSLARAISAYLWDNRRWLENMGFSKARQADVMVCLMMKQGYSEFDEYGAEIKEWCNRIIKTPPGHH